jgi:hypothetical protein
MRWNIIALLCGVSLSALPCAATPTTRPASKAAMLREIQSLQTRIDQLETHHARTDSTVPTEDSQKLMDQIVDDADRQSDLFSIGPFSSGYDPEVGFVLRSDDGNYSMHPSVLLQARYALENRNRILPGEGGAAVPKQGDDTEDGFEISRLRFSLDGNVISPQLTYYLLAAKDASTANPMLLDAYVMYRVGAESSVAVKVGQFKDPVWHEQNLLPSRLLAADRSLANELVGGGQTNRIQGAALVFDRDRARWELAIHDGYNAGNTTFYGPSGTGAAVGAGAGTAPTNWGASGRGEYLVVGDRTPEFNPYSEYDQFTALDDRQNILVTGGGFDYSESGANKIFFHTVDAQFNTTRGLMLYAAYLGAYRNYYTNRGVAPGSYYDSAVLLQAAYLVTPRLEPFIRYDYTHLDGRAEPGIIQDNLDEITIGANYYWFGQRAKFTVDGSWLPNGSPADEVQQDILQDNSHNEFLLQAQFQLSL